MADPLVVEAGELDTETLLEAMESGQRIVVQLAGLDDKWVGHRPAIPSRR